MSGVTRMAGVRAAVEQGPGLDGEDIYELKIIFLNLAAAAITYGLFLCVGIMAAYTLIRKGLHGKGARQALLAIVITMLLAATAHLALYMGYIILQFPTLAAEYVDPQTTLDRLNISQTCLRRLTYFLSDIIVVWRAWVLWEGNRIAHAVLAFCIVATGATSLTVLIFNFNTTFHHIHYTRDAQNFLGSFSLLVTNFTATAFIGWKLCYYRKNVKKYINRSASEHTKVESVLILLMESGGLYCVFWILLMIGDYGYYGPDFGFEWFQPNISGLYPTIIIFMVSQKMLICEEVLSFTGSLPSSTRTADMERTVWLARSGQTAEDSSVVLNSFGQKQSEEV